MTTPLDLDASARLAEEVLVREIRTEASQLAAALLQAVAELRAARAEVERRGELVRRARELMAGINIFLGDDSMDEWNRETERMLEGKT